MNPKSKLVMAGRTRAREVALQALFQEDLNPRDSRDQVMPLLENRLKEIELRDFAVSLVLGVLRNREELDALIAAKAENWSVSRMAATDRNILRLGAYEIRYTDTPPRVAVDEAVELAKRFGAANSSQFVNGILDKLIERKE
jgi:transcription antitermination protein NusB